MDELSDEEDIVSRARRIQFFLSQPFSLRTFTGLPGHTCLRNCSQLQEILDGKYANILEPSVTLVPLKW